MRPETFAKARRWVFSRAALRWLAIGAGALVAFFLFAFLVAAAVLWRTAGEFAGYEPRQPSRIHAQPAILRVGDRVSLDELTARLRAEDYRPAESDSGLPGGTYRVVAQSDPTVLIARRALPADAELHPTAGIVSVRLADGAIAALSENGLAADQVALEPALIAAYYGPDLRECRPVELDRMPRHLIDAVLAAEDASYFHHPGLSAAGIARAAMVNWAAGRIEQGGSTITQQLVRNLYLTQERTWGRKAREAWLSLIVEMRYAKEPILEAYLNEIYLGRRGKVNLIGVGAAAHALFGKAPERLSLEDAALIAALIQSPGDYDPTRDPRAALKRRNWVLERMAAAGFITPARARAAAAEPLRLSPLDLAVVFDSPAPHFAVAMAAEARRRFAVDDLEGGGYELRSTLRRWDQEQARAAVAAGLEELKGSRQAAALEGALVSLDPRDGAVLAWVGGRDFAHSQFDRVAQARRQAGSAFKPFVYAAALQGGAGLGDWLADLPLTVALGGDEWVPQNEDGQFRGPVTVRAALESSLNVPTVRLAFAAGLENVAAAAQAAGLAADARRGPALALGAVDVTPLELAAAYAALAAGGAWHEPHGLAQVFDRDGREVGPRAPLARRHSFDRDVAHLVTSMLQGVVERGTGAGARRLGLRGEVAGKTGTSDGRRDSWFAGYSSDRAAVAWVGRDDNRPTRQSGSRAALPIWTKFMLAVEPAAGYADFEPSPGVVEVEIDPLSGELAGPQCPERRRELYLASRVPVTQCTLLPRHSLAVRRYARLHHGHHALRRRARRRGRRGFRWPALLGRRQRDSRRRGADRHHGRGPALAHHPADAAAAGRGPRHRGARGPGVGRPAAEWIRAERAARKSELAGRCPARCACWAPSPKRAAGARTRRRPAAVLQEASQLAGAGGSRAAGDHEPDLRMPAQPGARGASPEHHRLDRQPVELAGQDHELLGHQQLIARPQARGEPVDRLDAAVAERQTAARVVEIGGQEEREDQRRPRRRRRASAAARRARAAGRRATATRTQASGRSGRRLRKARNGYCRKAAHHTTAQAAQASAVGRSRRSASALSRAAPVSSRKTDAQLGMREAAGSIRRAAPPGPSSCRLRRSSRRRTG